MERVGGALRLFMPTHATNSVTRVIGSLTSEQYLKNVLAGVNLDIGITNVQSELEIQLVNVITERTWRMQALAWNEIINELRWNLDAVHDFETRSK